MTVCLRSWHFLALATALLAIGCSNVGGESGGSTVYDDAGNCVKDREALSQILVQPQACVSSTECPPGSFCNGETGQCDWECYTDSDCGFGASCTCDGICLDGSPPGPGSTEDPACPRDLTILQDTTPEKDIHNRECTRDEHCPYGARCDEVTHRCTYDCLADTDCTGGNVCNCLGECVEPGCASPVAERHVPTVEVTPDVITVLPGNTWGKQTFSIRITDPDATIADPDPTYHPAGLLPRARIEAPTPTGLGNLGIPQSTAVAETVNTYAGVHFSTTEETNSLAHANTASSTTLTSGGIPVAIADRMVAARPFASLAAVLEVDGAGASTLQALKTATQVTGPACTIQVRELLDTRWVVTKTDGYSATTSVSISRCSAADSYPRDIRVSVYFVDADTSEVVRDLASRIVQINTAGAADLTPTPSTGEFSGYLVEENALGAPLTIPVRAWGDDSTGNLVVADDLKLLSSTGWFQLSTAGPTFLNHINQATGNGGVSPGQTFGVLGGELGNWTDELLTGGRRDGHFTLALASSPDQPLAFRYRLVRKGPGAPPTLPSAPPSSVNTLANASDAWRAKAGFLASGVSLSDTTRANLVERLLCYGYDDSLGGTPPLVGPAEQESGRETPQLLFSSASDDAECTRLGLNRASHTQSAIGLIAGWQSWAFPVNYQPVPADPITAPPVESAAWLSECLGDLTRAIPALGSGSPTQTIGVWFGAPGSCINLAQILPAFASLVHEPLDGNGTRYIDRRDATLFQRVLAGWMDVHAFVLHQGIQDDAAAGPLTTGETTPIATLLAIAERGWDVMFDADHLAALRTIASYDLANPDYRRPRPSAYWSFDTADRQGNHFIDVAGGNHLDLTAGSYSSDEGGIHLDPSSYAIVLPPSLTTTGDVSVTFWLRPSSLSPINTDVDIVNSEHAFFVKARRSSTGWWITAGHDGYSFSSDVQTSITSNWKHITVTRRGLLYGIWSGTEKIASPLSQTSTQPTQNTWGYTIIGPNPGTGGSVSIDDLAIWEHAITEQHIQEIVLRGQSSATNVHPLLNPIGSAWMPSSPHYHPVDPNADQNLGLPLKILETATRHAGAVDAYARQQLEQTYGGCYATGTSGQQQASIDRAASSLRYVTAAETVARELRARAGQVTCTGDLECTASGGDTCSGEQWFPGQCMLAGSTLDIAPAWDERYQSALLELAAARASAAASIGRLASCDNPLGIPENDLPIYFGDVDGTNARYFASSDYLMSSWARPAVQTSMQSLEAARDGWLAKRDSDIRQLMNEYEAERRLEGIELGKVQSVIDACGLTEIDPLDVLKAFKSGQINLKDCFRSSDCSPNDNSPSCIHGSLGQAYLAVRDAALAVLDMKAQSIRQEDEWNHQIDQCKSVELGYVFQDGPDPPQSTVREYLLIKDSVQDDGRKYVENVMGQIRGFLDYASGIGKNDWATDMLQRCLDEQQQSGGTAVCAAAFGGANLEIDATLIDGQLEKVVRAIIEFPTLAESSRCWGEIGTRQRDWVFGLDSLVERLVDLGRAWNEFDELYNSTARKIDATYAEVSREEGRTLPSVAHHYWLDEKIGRFQRDFVRAKRFSYLAMRAVEFEFQQSLGLRTRILTASHPDDLVEALDILDAERATRSINSRRPAPGTEVLSLRSDILALTDLELPSGERASTAAAQLQDILTSPEYAYRDENGDYLGQAIPFTVAESGSLRYRCGERLWRVTATIQGDLTDIDEPRAQVYLLKRNVFKSQWCEGLGDDTRYQQGSTAGGSNLFTADATTVGRQGSEYTPALIYPWYNVRRSDFYRDDYTQGSSEELAGRGVYGEYVLLFPNYGMLEPPADCPESNTCGETGQSAGCSDPFRDLRRIEDVLLRFDYYSVDDL
jgi:hypothetical protein